MHPRHWAMPAQVTAPIALVHDPLLSKSGQVGGKPRKAPPDSLSPTSPQLASEPPQAFPILASRFADAFAILSAAFLPALPSGAPASGQLPVYLPVTLAI